jgi:hypothetical protein
MSGFTKSRITAFGGTSGAASKSGGAGTVYLKKKGGEEELVVCNNGTVSSYNPNIFPQLGPSAITGLTADRLEDSAAFFMPKALIGMALIPNVKHRERTFAIIDNDLTTITVATEPGGGDLLSAAAVGDTYAGKFVFAGTVSVRNAAPAFMYGEAELGGLSVTENSVLSHDFATTARTAFLSIKASKVEVDGTSRIDATGKGYLGGISGDNSGTTARTLGNTKIGGSVTGCGGSYGGYGGVYSTSTGFNFANGIYGSLYDPNDLGSGGGGYNSAGGNGGGIVRIKAAEMVLDGEILAGGSIFSTTGGSGGSIKVEAGTLRGAGRIAADGSGSPSYSAGGGGRIAVYYDDMSGFTKSRITAFGGAGNSASKSGGAGTVYLKKNSDPEGEIVIDNNDTTTTGYSTTLPAVGEGSSTSLTAHSLTNTGASFIPGALIGIKLNPRPDLDKVFTIVSNDGFTLSTDPDEDDMTLFSSPGYPYIGEHRLMNLTVKGLARVFTLDRVQVSGTLAVEAGSTLKAANLER